MPRLTDPDVDKRIIAVLEKEGVVHGKKLARMANVPWGTFQYHIENSLNGVVEIKATEKTEDGRAFVVKYGLVATRKGKGAKP
jgi:hypothetical protein